MPKLSRWFIKTGIIYLVFALFMGIGLEFPNISLLNTYMVNLFPSFYHALAVGWITQLIFGVAYWMFPRYSKEEPRGKESLGWLVYIFINAGLIMRVIFEPINGSGHRSMLVMTALVISAILQWLAGLLFAVNTWSRVKGRNKKNRKRA